MTFFRLMITLLAIALALSASACDSNFYLSEAEASAYTNLFINESTANSFIYGSLPGQTLTLQFNNATSPPSISSTNLLSLMRNQTTLGFIEGVNNQVRLDRLNSELQTQLENYVRNRLDLYNGQSSADIKLTRLNYINITFLNRPTFTYRAERQAISFNSNITMVISGTLQVNALDAFTNAFFGVNGTYPLVISVNNLNLSGDVMLSSAFADASQIALKITPTVGSIGVTDGSGSTAPNSVKTGVAEFLRQELSQPLSAGFMQRYNYFSLAGLALQQGYAGPPATLRETYIPTPNTARPMMHIVARAADGKLYHQQKTEGGQNIISSSVIFPSLAARIENEPALYASATDQLEVAATTVTGQLVFAHWSDDNWGGQTTVAPPAAAVAFRGKPAIIASAPGQVEIIVAGQNGSLWHIRRTNSIWSTPVAVPIITLPGYRTAPYRDPVVALSGNKVFTAFIDSQNRLNGSLFDLESGFWGQASPITTSSLLNSAFAPAVAATGNGQVELVYASQTGAPFHRIVTIDAARFTAAGATTGIVIVNNEISIGGTLNATPALVCSSYRQIELIGRGTDNHLYHNHFVGPDSPGGLVDGQTVNQGWQGWSGMASNFSGTLTFFNMTAFSAAVTGTGKVGVVSITQPNPLDNNPQQYLNYNTYDSTRYGVQPWKTVGWRGTERIQSTRFIGQPAIAMVDRNTSLSYVRSDFVSLQRSALAESNVILPSALQSNVWGVLGVAAATSMPNYTDVVIAGTDHQIRHFRCKQRGLCSTRLLPLTPFTSYRRIAVTGYGNGYLDVVANTDEGHPYHWRFQNGTWSQGVDISPATPYTGPVTLVNIGSGRLCVVLVNAADYPAVSYFSNGTWSATRVFTSFPIERTFLASQSVESWGDGAFDYAVVDRQNRSLWQGRIGPREYTGNPFLFNVTPGRSAVNLGGTINDVPVLTLFSPTRMQVIAEGTDNRLYTNWSRLHIQQLYQTNLPLPVDWGGYGGMDGNNLRISDVAKTGTSEMSLVAIDANGRLLINRFSGADWQQFQPLFAGSATTSSPTFAPMLTTY